MADPRSYFPAVNSIFSPPHEDQGQSMMHDQMMKVLTPIDLARNYYAQQIQNEIARQRAMNELPQVSPTPVAPITTAAAIPSPIPVATPRSYFPAVNPLGSNLVYRPNATPAPQPTSYLNPNLIAAKPNYSF